QKIHRKPRHHPDNLEGIEGAKEQGGADGLNKFGIVRRQRDVKEKRRRAAVQGRAASPFPVAASRESAALSPPNGCVKVEIMRDTPAESKAAWRFRFPPHPKMSH